MSTFQELMQKRNKARDTKTVLMKLVEYIDDNFSSRLSGTPKLRLLNDEDKTPVPFQIFDEVANELVQRAKALDEVLSEVCGTEVDTVKPTQAEAKS